MGGGERGVQAPWGRGGPVVRAAKREITESHQKSQIVTGNHIWFSPPEPPPSRNVNPIVIGQLNSPTSCDGRHAVLCFAESSERFTSIRAGMMSFNVFFGCFSSRAVGVCADSERFFW